MSLDLIKEIFSALPDCKEWHAHLLSFTHSKRNGTTYNCRRIELEPSERLNVLIQDISSGYTNEGKNKLDNYVDVREYDGTCNSTTVYRIRDNNPDIEIDLDALLQEIANSDSEADPFSIKARAYMLCGNMRRNDEDHQIKLISMNTPITRLKNRFWHNKGKFWKIPDKVLNLRTSMNVIIYDRTVYFMDMSGETLFNMERAYKHKCNEAVDEITGLSIISDPEMFRNTATSGQNPRRFAAFSKSKLQLLTKKKNREKAAKYFKIPLTKNKQFDTSQKVDAENLVKVLCGKAMWDVLEEVPVEVDGSKDWVR
ncbi:MAG: DUF4868 domain-containing protein [Ruminiclostridium sp.]|uniref:Kiwa anti-phage protein KwaB-like domain-containing protein n=1 Tax=Ruminococcus sp. TaxID=41978 RepID=UPI0025FC4D30|nr:Kiwa anti-phage protein KwaB-like domain-containing protein [Ruminococcus sp.]MBR1431408.1 DUF4868 domain-containing protein [Ruminococcus sp.]MBR1832282.1 DUF4868 domain-containing protein [Ruminiclostridium sp.]